MSVNFNDIVATHKAKAVKKLIDVFIQHCYVYTVVAVLILNCHIKTYFLELPAEKQQLIETNQWPPKYYQREKALYEKTLRQRALKEKSKNRIP